MVGRRKRVSQALITMVLWLVLAGTSVHGFFTVRGFSLTPKATDGIRPGWEVLSLVFFFGLLLVAYVVLAAVVSAVFRTVRGRETTRSSDGR